MNTQKLRSKRVVIPTLAAVAVMGAGGLVWSGAAADELNGGDRDRAGSAALEAVGEGEVTEAESDDDGGYEVEVTKADGTQVDVDLDQDFEVLGEDADDADEDGKEDGSDDDDGDGDKDADDRALSAEEQASAEKAALAEVDGTVTDVEAGDDAGEAYEVEVVTTDGAEWTVELDADFRVLDARADG